MRFIRSVHELGKMEVKSDFLASAFAKKSHKEARSSLDFTLSFSPLLGSLRESTNALLKSMGENVLSPSSPYLRLEIVGTISQRLLSVFFVLSFFREGQAK